MHTCAGMPSINVVSFCFGHQGHTIAVSQWLEPDNKLEISSLNENFFNQLINWIFEHLLHHYYKIILHVLHKQNPNLFVHLLQCPENDVLAIKYTGLTVWALNTNSIDFQIR